jgi:hypothetical protein
MPQIPPASRPSTLKHPPAHTHHPHSKLPTHPSILQRCAPLFAFACFKSPPPTHPPTHPSCNTAPQVIYCNAEGISWIDHFRIVIASDKAKSNQPFWSAAGRPLPSTPLLLPPRRRRLGSKAHRPWAGAPGNGVGRRCRCAVGGVAAY